MGNHKARLLFIGGHVTPAYAVLQELQERGYKNLYFVGRKYSDRKQKDISFEYQEITRLKIPFYHLTTGRFVRNIGLHTLTDFLSLISGFINAYVLIQRIRPQVIVSFGGYIAVPICIVGWIKGIKIITHEQTLSPGIANKIIGRIALKVLIAFPDIQNTFNSKKTILTGNPLRKELFGKGEPLCKLSQKPMLFITGGSLGAHAINILVEKILHELSLTFLIIHQIGNSSAFNDYARLSRFASSSYHPYINLLPSQMVWALRTSDVVVSRAGANTLAELIALKKRAILIPLPYSGNGEQQKNAEFYERSGLGTVFSQKSKPEELFAVINNIWKKNSTNNSLHNKLPDNTHAASRVADIIESCVE